MSKQFKCVACSKDYVTTQQSRSSKFCSRRCYSVYRRPYATQYARELKQRRRTEDPEYDHKMRERDRTRLRPSLENRPDTMLKRVKKTAKKKGLDFNLDLSDVQFPDPFVCPVLGIPLDTSPGRGANHPNTPSLDRINNDLGYVKGNVRIISCRANSIKRDANIEEILKIYEYMQREIKQKLEQ